ncbi:TIGR03773 family transporter-associated surface protein [Micromonospora sp. CA-263727]|uniref:TIGR03773 family transporter-associated surface protein n=1 Tax=Micromonospora sp. CA-263727 TaxID=3239967 RepID=UPI003D939D72
MIAVPRPAGRAVAAGRRVAAVAAALALAGFAAVPVPAAAAPPAGQETSEISVAGTDLLSVAMENGDLDLRIRETLPQRKEAVRDPSTVLLGPDGGTPVRVPDHPALRFLGQPGREMWALTAGDLHFPYLDTTGVRHGAVRGDTIGLSLDGVEGPGEFAAYTINGLGKPTPIFGNVAGMPRDTRLPVATRTGAMVWLFAAAGDYRVTVTAAATTTSGDDVSAAAVYRIRVPQFEARETPPSPVPAPAPAPAPQVDRAAPAPSAESDTRASASSREAPLVAPAAAATTPAPPVSAASSGRVVIDDGHVDMGPQLDGADWTIRLKDDTVTPARWRDLADVVLHVKDNAKTTVPAGADFLGSPGDTVWLLPQAQQSGIVWPGWNTQHPSVISGTRGPVTWTFKGATGPGRFTLFLTGSFGAAEVLFNSATRLPQRLAIPANTHAHGNWAFSKPGIYRLAFEMSATTTAGKQVTDTKTLTFAVGDATDPKAGSGAGNGSGSGADGTGSGSLARTGSSWRLPAFGVGLVIAGGIVLALLRNPRRKHPLRAESPGGERPTPALPSRRGRPVASCPPGRRPSRLPA